jgi:hypothetical protein
MKYDTKFGYHTLIIHNFWSLGLNIKTLIDYSLKDVFTIVNLFEQDKEGLNQFNT